LLINVQSHNEYYSFSLQTTFFRLACPTVDCQSMAAALISSQQLRDLTT